MEEISRKELFEHKDFILVSYRHERLAGAPRKPKSAMLKALKNLGVGFEADICHLKNFIYPALLFYNGERIQLYSIDCNSTRIYREDDWITIVTPYQQIILYAI